MWVTWRAAMRRALYGDGGFYLRERPDRHFRTSVHVSAAFAEAVLRLIARTDDALGCPAEIDFVDVGSGDGRLPTLILAAAPAHLARRLRITAVDLGPRPHGLDERIGWAAILPQRIEGLAIANEWLDNIPLDVVEQTPTGPRLVLVDPDTGDERLGPPPDPDDLAWLERWWPLRLAGQRAEVGRPRDQAWAGVMAALSRGMAVAVDYAHRTADRPPLGSLTAYRDGALVPAVPDGSCDLTAHVALDACAEAGERAGATVTRLTTQREALRELGIHAAPPSLDLAQVDACRYVQALARRSEEAELIDPCGLGGFGWLTQARGITPRPVEHPAEDHPVTRSERRPRMM